MIFFEWIKFLIIRVISWWKSLTDWKGCSWTTTTPVLFPWPTIWQWRRTTHWAKSHQNLKERRWGDRLASFLLKRSVIVNRRKKGNRKVLKEVFWLNFQPGLESLDRRLIVPKTISDLDGTAINVRIADLSQLATRVTEKLGKGKTNWKCLHFGISI